MELKSRDSKELPASSHVVSGGGGYLQILDFYEEKYLLGYSIDGGMSALFNSLILNADLLSKALFKKQSYSTVFM